MRFSDLKKKFPSLRVSVLVIAAFALLGLMMIPSISEKMGLNEGLCVAEDGWFDEYGYDKYGYSYEDWDYFLQSEYQNCVDAANAMESSLSRSISTNCKLMNPRDAAGYKKCVANSKKWIAKWHEEALEKCEEKWLDY